MDPDSIRRSKAFDGRWFHSLELAPGVYTRGQEHRNLALTRDLLRDEAAGPPHRPADASSDPFDVVIFSGVPYHMFDPLGGLASVRGFVRNGGVCLSETAVAFDGAPRGTRLPLDARH